MHIYPMTIEPDVERGGIWARFKDVPTADFWEFESDAATLGAPHTLRNALIYLFQIGERMPLASPLEEGQLGIVAPVVWSDYRHVDYSDDD